MPECPIAWERLSQPILRRYLVIAAISQQKCSLPMLVEKTGIPVSSLRRTLRSLRVELGMDVRYINTNVSNVYEKGGYYRIEHWGIVDQSFFLGKIAESMPL